MPPCCPPKQQTYLLCPSIAVPTEQSRDYCERDISIICETSPWGYITTLCTPLLWCPFFLPWVWTYTTCLSVAKLWRQLTCKKRKVVAGVSSGQIFLSEKKKKSVAPELATSASPQNLLEIQIFGHHPRIRNSGSGVKKSVKQAFQVILM